MATKGAWEELFGGGRKWRVAEEVTFEVTEDGFEVDCDWIVAIALISSAGPPA